MSASASASATAAADHSTQPASYKVIGVLLAVGSGLFIGCSFILKKKVRCRDGVRGRRAGKIGTERLRPDLSRAYKQRSGVRARKRAKGMRI